MKPDAGFAESTKGENLAVKRMTSRFVAIYVGLAIFGFGIVQSPDASHFHTIAMISVGSFLAALGLTDG